MTKLQMFSRFIVYSSVISILLLISGCGKKEPEKAPVVRPVLAVKVGDVRVMGVRSFPGRARAVQEANLAFEVGGTLKERPVKLGDTVRKGQLLASLDPRDYLSSLKAAQAEYTKSRANFERAKELVEKNYISKAEYDRMQAATDIDASKVETASKALGDTELKAPFAGRVSELYVENFQVIQPKQQVIRLVDTSRIEMVVDIPEALISMVPYVKSVLVTFEAFPDKVIKAGVKEIGAEASKTTRTYEVVLVMDQPEGFTVLPGMAGVARGNPDDIPKEIVEQGIGMGIQVPTSAVFSADGSNKSYVWIIDEKSGIASRREVTTGQIRSTGLQIKQGLKSGEWIATAGVHHLREGQKVRLQPVQGD